MSLVGNTDFEVHITEVSGGEIANYLVGYIEIRGQNIPFTAVAYGRVGGQNVSPDFEEEAVDKLRKLGLEIESFKLEVQRRLVEGRVITHGPPSPPDF